jgi:hypothetical protein
LQKLVEEKNWVANKALKHVSYTTHARGCDSSLDVTMQQEKYRTFNVTMQ